MDQLLGLFAPQPVNLHGRQWGDLTVFERVATYNWNKELIILGMIVVYVSLHYIGVRINRSKIQRWIDTHKFTLGEQFAQVGVKLPHADLVVADSPSIYTTYASGRLNVEHLLCRIKLIDRQNFITVIMDYVIGMFYPSFVSRDAIDIIITPSEDAKIDPFIFAVVNKSDMNKARQDNYYLSLTRTVDSDKLPPYLVFMSEVNEVTDTMFTNELAEAVKDSKNVLELLAVTDQEISRPRAFDDTAPRTVVRLSLKFPRNTKEIEASNRLINAAINLVDHAIEKGHWRSEVTKKIKLTRESEIKKIQRAIDETKAEEIARKKAELRREQLKAQSKLSTAEQRKIEQKEREKEQKRKLSKQAKRSTVR